jgi:endonuclease/exonuclease/phosphatase family metal-dependent hydrolase
VLGYLALAFVSTACLWWLSDRWWLATTLLFGPRWLLLLPLLVLIPLAVRWDRPVLAPLVLSFLVVLGPVMGFRTGWRKLLTSPDSERDIKVVSFNARGGLGVSRATTELMLDWEADIAAFQECRGPLQYAIQQLRDWNTDVTDGLCLISRFPITTVEQMERDAFQVAGGSALVVTYRLDVRGQPVTFTNVHLETPRAGLERIRAGELDEGIPKLQEKSSLREIELRRARRWVEEFPRPHIVVGDFNTPPESPIYRAAWSSWQNAFSVAGRGFGGTRLSGWIRVRIDHILVDQSWRVIDSKVGDDVGSDHLPVLTTLRWKYPL